MLGEPGLRSMCFKSRTVARQRSQAKLFGALNVEPGISDMQRSERSWERRKNCYRLILLTTPPAPALWQLNVHVPDGGCEGRLLRLL